MFVLTSLVYKAQNLIVNGSFEIYNNLSCNSAMFDVSYWSVLRSPDYFTTQCNAVSGGGIPYNMFGCIYPKSGNAYAGIGTISYPYENKEYIYQHLTTPLLAEKSYYVSFFFSKSDKTRIATEKLGVYFSSTAPIALGGTYVNAIPQVENQNGFLTDTINWTKLEGYYTARGGEEYITIGNFNSNANTDTLHTGTTNPFFADAGTAYYYIDSVSLYDSLDYVTNIKSHENKIKWNLYPNPNKGVMTLEYDLGNMNDATMNLYDVTGKLLTVYKLPSAKGTLQMNEQTLENGIYFYHILVEGKSIKTDKIVIIK